MSSPLVCASGTAVPVQGSVFWPDHCSSGLHSGHGPYTSHSSLRGAQVLQYLNDWLVLVSSLTQSLLSWEKVLAICQELGILVSLK